MRVPERRQGRRSFCNYPVMPVTSVGAKSRVLVLRSRRGLDKVARGNSTANAADANAARVYWLSEGIAMRIAHRKVQLLCVTILDLTRFDGHMVYAARAI